MRKTSRRSFIKKSALAGAALTFGSSAIVSNAASYRQIIGANDRINAGVAGLRSRGQALLGALQNVKDVEIASLCDVDSNVLKERHQQIKAKFSRVNAVKDFRKMIESKDVDVVAISSPDHTHTPFAIYAMQAGKHVYVEKPMSHNPYEGDLLVNAQKKYGSVVQVGNQQRSAPSSQQAVRDIRAGLIGDVYHAFCWYSSNRGPIGRGKNVPVPEWLDWDLWQGPAPRKPYADNIVHYNWHWFKHWGTGEVNNNGLHELDVCRWGLGVDYPSRVVSSGGRFAYNDDWEFFDSQDVTYFFANGRTIQWKGYSCNNVSLFDRGRGTIFYGTKGSIMVDRNSYQLYDLNRKMLNEVKEEQPSGTVDIVGDGPLVIYHMKNFIDAIRTQSSLNSPVGDINKSNQLCHYGNIAQFEGGVLNVDPQTGRCSEDIEKKYWKREYAPGWEPRV
jgi:predicted dehydrogenase